MLQTIRDKSQGLIVGVIVFLISLTFALWGIQSYIGNDSGVVVAEAAGEAIELGEFQDALQRYRRQAQSILGEAFDASSWDSPEVRMRALDELIDERILKHVTDVEHIRISDLQVARQLHQIPSFQDDNGFSRQLYEQRVPQLGMSTQGFEQKLRLDMAQSQLRAGVAASEFVTREEALRIERLREQKRDIGYAIIPASLYTDKVSVTDADAAAYFDQHQEAFRTDEKVKLEYLSIAPSDLVDEIDITEELLKEFYEANRAAYTLEEERNVNHILVQVPQSASAEEEKAALEKVTAALSRARDGESFEALAGELSDDVGSRAEGGETGLFGRGVMAPEFEETAFKLKVGEISEPIRTKFGFHILKLKEIKRGGLQSFEEVRSKVESAYREKEAQRLFYDRAEQFSTLVYEHPDSLTVAADGLNLEVQQTDWLSAADIAAMFSDKLAARAFEPEVLMEGLNAEPAELPDGRVVALRVSEHRPSSIPTLEEVRPAVNEALQTERLRTMTEAAGRELIEKLRAGGDAAELVTESGFGWESAEGVGRDSKDVNRAVLRVAFRTEVESDAPTYTGIPIGTSDYAIVRVANVSIPAAADLGTAAATGVQRELLPPRSETVWRDFLTALRASSDVQVFEENL